MKITRLLRTYLPPLALGAGLAACGSSGSTVSGIQLAPSAGPTTATTVATATATSTSQTVTVATPKPPSPLSKKPVVKIPSGPAPKGLVRTDLIKGTGPVAKPGGTVTVNYVGVLYKGGKEFDSSWKRSQTFTTPLTPGAVIDGWVNGIPGMKVGGRRELIIPASLAYKQASQPGIPANSTLVFVVDLLAVS